MVGALQAGLPLGAAGSRLLSGNKSIHDEVEAFLQNHYSSESALLFSSGYSANLSIMTTLGENESVEFFSDSLNHASLIDGMRLTKSKKTIFRHNDLEDLRAKLNLSQTENKVIVTEAVFSMDGDLAPLRDLLILARENGAWLVVDEAHSTGVFGPAGLGLASDFRYEKLVCIHTCGKALGSQGAFVLSSQVFREAVINFARPFIFTTALSPLLTYQIRAAIEISARLKRERDHLHSISDLLRQELKGQFDLGKSQSQIIPVILGSNERVLAMAQRLQSEGFDVRAIRSPTVPEKTERLRISLNATRSKDEVMALTGALKRMNIQ